jgi:hypothetical protein
MVWPRFGDVPNFCEPFFGSGAVLLGRPDWDPDLRRLETVNDLDGYVSNFWRSLATDPECTAHYADWPVNENDLHARHIWLLNQKEALVARLEGDPDFCDPKIAGWWVWGLCCWIGSGWCSGEGPWQSVEGVMTRTDEPGAKRQLVHLGNAGRGVNRKCVHLSNAGRGVNRKRVLITNDAVGVANNEPGVPLVNEQGVPLVKDGLYAWFDALSARLARVRVCCGDWSRVCGPTPTVKQGLTGVFLDPPYSAEAGRCGTLYTQEDLSVAHDVRRWCLEWGDDPRLRIALCGYAGEAHEELEAAGWECVAWKAAGGYGSQGEEAGRVNSTRERIWFSPHCLPALPDQGVLDLA